MKKSLLKASAVLAAISTLGIASISYVAAQEETEETEVVETMEEETADEEVTEAEEDASEETADGEVVPAYAEDGELQDGTYRLVSNADERGWAAFLEITVAEGEITEADFDYTDEEGNLKSEDEEYNASMEEQAGISFADAAEEIEAQLVEGQDPEVDTVSGATGSAEIADQMADVLLAMAQNGLTEELNYDEVEYEGAAAEGETIPAYAEDAELEDGTYRLVTNPDERGWAAYLEITVAEGEVTEADFDYTNEEGVVKSEDEEYNANMEEGSGTSFADASVELEAQLVDGQDPEIDTVSGATSSSELLDDMADVIFAMAQNGITEEVNYDEANYEGAAEETEESEEETVAAVTADGVEDGTYEGTAAGYIGDITVEVVVADGAITDVQVTSQEETEGIADEALETVPQAIVDENSTDVDTVSGATGTSNGIKEAVAQALQGA